MVSLFCRAIRSISWLTMNEGGRARRPPGGIRTRSRHIGHLHHTLASVLARGGAGRGGAGMGAGYLKPSSRASAATILVRQLRQTVWEQGSSLGPCSAPS